MLQTTSPKKKPSIIDRSYPPLNYLGSLSVFLSPLCRNIVIGSASFLPFLEHRAVSLADLLELLNILRATVICVFVVANSRICVIRST